MTSEMATVRAGLATRIATISGFLGRTHAMFPDRLTAPAAIISVPAWDYHQPHNRIRADVLLLAAEMGKGAERAQAKLDSWLDGDDPNSVKAAIEAEPTLGGAAQDVIVTGWGDYGEVEVNGQSYLGAVVHVEIAT